MLVENEKVKKVHLMGVVHQTLAGENQGLKTMEVWLITLPPGAETPADQHYGEVVGMTLKGTGQALSWTATASTWSLIPAWLSQPRLPARWRTPARKIW